MAEAAHRQGAGAGASHLVSGHGIEHEKLEEELAAFTQRERALLFSTGYMANLAVIAALVGRGELALLDRLNHASLIDGALLAGARLKRYAHADAAAAERALAVNAGGAALLATDGVFSMDGDCAPLPALAQACSASTAPGFLVDDARMAWASLGATGRWHALEAVRAGRDSAVPILVGTLGKAFGTFLAPSSQGLLISLNFCCRRRGLMSIRRRCRRR